MSDPQILQTNFDQMYAMASQVQQVCGQLETQLAFLMGEVTKVQDSWQGRAGDEFQRTGTNYNAASRDMIDALAELRRIMEDVTGEHEHFEQASLNEVTAAGSMVSGAPGHVASGLRAGV